MYQARYFKDHYFNAIEVIRPVAEKHDLTLLEVALRWVIHHSQLNYEERDGVIIGCSSVEQLESNLKDFEKGPLPEDVVQALDVSSCLSRLTNRKPGRSSNRRCRTTGMLHVIWTVLNRLMHEIRRFYINCRSSSDSLIISQNVWFALT